VSADLEAVILACLAKRPDERPSSALALRERLAACASAGRWTHARAAQWWADHRHALRSGGARKSAAGGDEAGAAPLTVTRLAG
jgi:serine/threonine-protein kinase